MYKDSPSPETTLVIILGASKFPKARFTDSNSFRNSAEYLKDYFLAKDGFGLEKDNLLYLFDCPNPPSLLDEEIANFLKQRQFELETNSKRNIDVILYYVGHGGFFGGKSEFFLALQSTRDANPLVSSYTIKSLSYTLKEHARDARKYLIFDCCYAASVFTEFQGEPQDLASQKTMNEFPPKGTALLCAASADDPARNPPYEKFTMFSGALYDVLKKGDKNKSVKLSLSETGNMIWDIIRDRFPNEAVRPEVHSPYKKQGDLAVLPIFPNQALKEKAKEDTREYFNLGYASYEKKDYSQAIEFYSKAIELDPKYTNAYYNRGLAYYDKGENDKAIEDNIKAIELNPEYADAYISRGLAYKNKGEYDKAIQDYTKAIDLDPKYALAYNNRGIAYKNKGEYDKAIQDYTKAIELNPKYALAYNNRGIAYYNKGEYDKAIEDYTKAIELNPKYTNAYYNRGLAYYDIGEYDKAIEDYTKAIDLDSKYALAYNNLNDLLKHLDEHKDINIKNLDSSVIEKAIKNSDLEKDQKASILSLLKSLKT